MADWISDIQANDLTGTLVTVGTSSSGVANGQTQPVVAAILSQPGIVTTVAGSRSYSSWSFLVNDSTGGVDVFGKFPTGTTYTPTVGDGVTVAGTWSPYNELPEVETLTQITLNSQNNPVPAALNSSSQIGSGPGGQTGPLNCANLQYDALHNGQTVNATSGTVSSTSLPNDIGGTLITLDNVQIEGVTSFGTANISGTLSDSSGTTTMYYWPSSYSVPFANLAGMSINPNGLYNVTGVVDNYAGNQPEFLPMSIAAVAPVPEPGTLALLGTGVTAASVAYFRRKSRRGKQSRVGRS